MQMLTDGLIESWRVETSLLIDMNIQNFDAKFTVGTYSDGNLLVVYEIKYLSRTVAT